MQTDPIAERTEAIVLGSVKRCRVVRDAEEPVGKELVKDISMQIHHGDVVVVVRPGGTGKSSFLRLLGGLSPSLGSPGMFRPPSRPASSRLSTLFAPWVSSGPQDLWQARSQQVAIWFVLPFASLWSLP